MTLKQSNDTCSRCSKRKLHDCVNGFQEDGFDEYWNGGMKRRVKFCENLNVGVPLPQRHKATKMEFLLYGFMPIIVILVATMLLHAFM